MCVQYLSAELPFDEAGLVEQNSEYLLRCIRVESIVVKQASADAASADPGILQAEPGHPVPRFRD